MYVFLIKIKKILKKILFSFFYCWNTQISLNLSLVTGVNRQPMKKTAQSQSPERVACCWVKIKTLILVLFIYQFKFKIKTC